MSRSMSAAAVALVIFAAPAARAQTNPPARETGDLLVAKLENIFMPEPPSIRPTLGDFRPGAGFALGEDSVVPLGPWTWTTSAAMSVNDFRQAGTAFERPIASDHLRARLFLNWTDEPELVFYGVGMGSALSNEIGYGLHSQEAGFELQARGPRWFNAGASASDLRISSNDGTGSAPPVSALPGDLPGIDASPDWFHATTYAAIDTRKSPGYTDSGGLYRVALLDYVDRSGAFDFTRTEVDLRQFVPVLHDNWIVALQARADLTPGSELVPYFMLPSLGGRDTIPGFTDYRFTDKNSLLLRSELRWTATSVVDMAVFLDQGTVAANPTALDLHDLSRGWGIGARVHGPTFTALRVEAAHSVEGWRFNLAHNISF